VSVLYDGQRGEETSGFEHHAAPQQREASRSEPERGLSGRAWSAGSGPSHSVRLLVVAGDCGTLRSLPSTLHQRARAVGGDSISQACDAERILAVESSWSS
jgi:hypothetical protein